jgi:hypothetical protein
MASISSMSGGVGAAYPSNGRPARQQHGDDRLDHRRGASAARPIGPRIANLHDNSDPRASAHIKASPFQPPWETIPWPQRRCSPQVIKIHQHCTDVQRVGMLLDLFV